MCCLFGLLDTRQQYSGAQKNQLLHALAAAAEARGTDAAGFAWNDCRMTIRKSPIPGHKLRFRARDDTVAVMGHTRQSTQGDAKHNRNNHPFLGRIGNRRFAFAHNGMIYNDLELREQFSLPHTEIETDSYVIVQLLERRETLDGDSLRFAAEQLEGSFTFTVLDEQDSLYLVKGDNPMCLLRFPQTGLFLYASTKDILCRALEKAPLPQQEAVVLPMDCGEIVKIDRDGAITRSRFNANRLLGWQYPHGSYIDELKAAAYTFGYTPEAIDRLLSRGFQPEEVEEMLYCRRKRT